MRRPRRRRSAVFFAAACGLVLVQAGCSPEAPVRDLHGSASEGLVYVLPDPDEPSRTDLWRARLSDGAVRSFMQTPERAETWPFWSVSASTLAFEIHSIGARGGGQQIVLWTEQGERDLPGVPARREAWAAWAPTGARLVYSFTNLRQPPTYNGIAVVDIESGEQRILVQGSEKSFYIRPEFDPDGVRVVAQRLSLRERAEDGRRSEVWLLGPEAPPRPVSNGDAYPTKARFTRDGRLVLLTLRDGRDGPGDLILVRPDGAEARPFASTPESDDHAARESPVRDEIAFISNRDGKHDLFLADRAGGTPRNLTRDLDFEVGVPRWSPNGDRIVVTASPYARGEEASSRRITPDTAHVLVLDREGHLVFDTRGVSPDWMPPWR